jgi:hypothetical protein
MPRSPEPQLVLQAPRMNIDGDVPSSSDDSSDESDSGEAAVEYVVEEIRASRWDDSAKDWRYVNLPLYRNELSTLRFPVFTYFLSPLAAILSSGKATERMRKHGSLARCAALLFLPPRLAHFSLFLFLCRT